MQTQREERSLGELFTDLTNQVSQLIRQEVRLARTEVTQKAKDVGKDVGFVAAGGFIAYTGLLAIIGGIVALLALALPVWLSAIIVGVVVVVIGYVLLQRGMSALKTTNLAPQETISTLKGALLDG